MLKMTPDPGIRVLSVRVPSGDHDIPIIIVMPAYVDHARPGVLWIHGGGYATGMKEMLYMGRGYDLVREFCCVVVSLDYRLSWRQPYPAALEDCHTVLLYMKRHARAYHIDPRQIMVGGESAGGGLCAALCMLTRDLGDVSIACQMPLYPMLDNFDTASSRDNHARIWNTRRNHQAWRLYLRNQVHEEVSPYGAPARQKDYRHLPPAYSFVSTNEPFLDETKTYFDNLQKAGVEAKLDIYEGLYHAFDMISPKRQESQLAIKNFRAFVAYALLHYRSEAE